MYLKNQRKSSILVRAAGLAIASVLTGFGGWTSRAQTPQRAPFVEPAPVYDPKVAPAFEEAEKALAHFKIPKDLKASVWAAEPQVSNAVAMSIDTRGRIWISETNRYSGGGVLDIRNIYDWVDEDLACRTVADRDAMVKRRWPDSWQELTKNPERIRLLEDSSGSGRCDHAVVWADGFHDLSDGIASGVLERKGNVYFTNMPNLWVLRDTNGQGVSNERKIMSTGYGVRYSFEGHDLHGLRFGPDGKLYFSCGDRGFNVKTKEGRELVYPDTGGVLRCDPDGSNLEVFCYGLRNPQKLCFDDHGNLFTGDNNSDHGDPAKWFYIVEGADCGWRVGYQHITKPRATGPLLMENIMAVEKNSTQFYNTPPIAHIGNGPSGCTFYPGTGMPDGFAGHFLLCDFRGGQVNSGIWTFTMQPHGASFTMEGKQQYLWQFLPTDVEFGVDGGIYAVDWINGWGRPNKGRIYRFFNEEAVKQAAVLETKRLLAAGMEKRLLGELIGLMGHADQRVRQEAQFEIADRGAGPVTMLKGIALGLSPQEKPPARPDLQRLHAIWAIGQIDRKNPGAAEGLVPALRDADEEVRAQAAKVLGESHCAAAFDALIALTKDAQPRVLFFAAQALGKLGNKAAVPAILDLLARNADKDAFVRHSCVTALAGIGDRDAVLAAARSSDPSVRLGVLETLRRWHSPDVAIFLHGYPDGRLLLEAARAINDVPIEAARPELAKLIDSRLFRSRKLDPSQNYEKESHVPSELLPAYAEPILRRAINANFREGTTENADAIARLAASGDVPESIRVEAIESLVEWEKPSIRDHVMGLIWPLPDKTRDGRAVAKAAGPVMVDLVTKGPSAVRIAALGLAEKIGIEPLETAYALVADTKLPAEVRAAALKVLAARSSPKLADALKIGLLDGKAAVLRREAIRLQTTQPEAVEKLNAILADASPADQQAVFSSLPLVGGEAADSLLGLWMDKLLAAKVAPAATLDLLEAAAKSKSAAVTAKVKQYEALRNKEDTLAQWRECMEGGDAAAGRKTFFEKQEVSCVRCHMIGKEGGGNVGPNLGDVGKRQGREYILE